MRIEKLNQTTKKKIFWKIYSKEVRIAMRCMKNR